YRRLIKDYSSILAPLTDLLAKNTKWKWSEECEQAFTTVKNLLSNFPILRAPDFDRPFVIAVDASRVGVGAVLFQSDDNGIEHPVSYFSKKLSRAQRNYSTIEQELLAIVLALQHFCVYVPPFGPEVVIYSDHHPLQFLHKFKFKNQRLTRWSLLLQEYNLRVRHIRGQDNVMADCLSRVGTGS
ncbi:Ty3/Gypsy family RNase HI domain-containing protein, partial [Klebsiella pneumoniae]|uniref:Ty3/Gypsy family RNase HI domain-containing protein n=1 Tax=Klebsiella pneumoniae TaxID=573 RepID=UPI003EBD71B5